MKYIIFTDLDGTLLDHDTYSYHKANEALTLVQKNHIPVVICTSKTQAEIEVYRQKLQNNDPFIPENGGAIFIPKNYFKSIFVDKKEDHYIIIELGISYHRIVALLTKIRSNTGAVIRGFSDLSAEEVAMYTGLDIASAKLSKKRFYSEPVIIEGDSKTIKTVEQMILDIGLNFTEGGRFHHLFSASTDKGKAVNILAKIYHDNTIDSITTIGLGDSLNDLPMLAAVDIPILVKKISGKYDQKVKLPHLVYADGIGPEGWNKAIQKILKGIN